MAEKERKCIGVVVGKPTKRHQTDLLKGIYRVAFENDMNVAVFGTSIARMSEENKRGEVNIYSLINYERLAGIVYLKDTIHFGDTDEFLAKNLVNACREFGIPAVVVDDEVDDMPSYFCDDTENVRTITEHFIKKHGCTDIAYLTGIKGHPHAERRLKVFLDTMEMNKLSVDQSRICYGDFWYFSGNDFVEQLLSSEKGLPEAIICANEPMAESVYKALFSRGIHPPRDILLAGYDDNLDTPGFISSTIRNSESVGKAACEGLMALIRGESVSGTHLIPCGTRLNYSLTCGCSPAYDINLMGNTNSEENTEQDYFSEFNALRGALTGSADYTSMLWTMDWFTYFLKDFTSLYICMCDGWDDPSASVDENDVQTGYTPEMQINYHNIRYPDGTNDRWVGNDVRFDTKEMFPKLFSAEGEPCAYIFRPLHFNERCFGYAVISFGSRLETPEEIFDFWINDVSDALESQRRLQNMRWLYGEMKRNAVTDMMTGLMNRNGFNLMLPQFIEDAKSRGAEVLLIMADLNNLKYINDTFGHTEGDESIKTAAGALSRTWMGGAVSEKNFRIGGDEFVKVACGSFTEEHIAEFKRALTDFLSVYNKTSGKPYPVYISLGFAKSPAETASVEALLNGADERMYADKVRLKKETGFDHKRKI